MLLRPEDFTCLKTVLKNVEAFSPRAPLLLKTNGTNEAFHEVREAKILGSRSLVSSASLNTAAERLRESSERD